MTEYASTQGQNLVTAPHPENGLLSAGVKVRKPISADSFRKLTAFLKKDGVIVTATPAPLVAPPAPAQVFAAETVLEHSARPVVIEATAPEMAPQTAAQIVVAEVVEPEIALEATVPTIVVETIAPELIPEPIAPIWAAETIAPEIVPEAIAPIMVAEAIVPEIAPELIAPIWAAETIAPEIVPEAITPMLGVEAITPELIPEAIAPIWAAETITPELIPEAIAPIWAAETITPEIIPETIAPIDFAVEHIDSALIIEASPFDVLPVEPVVAEVAALEPQISPTAFEVATDAPLIEVEPPKPTATALRQRPRDAFALSPSALPPSKPVAAVVPTQTPAQEQEAAELARSLLDMMASGASSGLPQERALAADTLLRMLPRLPLKSLIMLADRLCIMDAPPHLLVAKLICDPRIEVAGPLLEECSHITDEDLSLVIQEGEPAKRRMMARRRHVSRAITAQLVNTGDPSVLLNLVRNQNAEIPHEGFEQLVRDAAEQQELLAPLCIRADLPVPFAFELFWSAPAQLRRYLLSRFLTDSETLTKILKIALVTNGDESSKVEFPNPEKIMDALQMADDGKLDEAAEQLGECAKIHPKTAARILADRQGDPLAALFKATGVPRATMHEILQGLMKSASGMIDPKRDPEELQSLFDSLSFNKARILLTYWDWSTLKTGPYAPMN